MAAGPVPALEEASAIYLMIVHPVLGDVWSADGSGRAYSRDFRLFPMRGCILPTARVLSLSAFGCLFFICSFYFIRESALIQGEGEPSNT